MDGKIFISYRRGDDPGSAGRLLDALKAAFGADQLFIDVDNIEPGLDFVKVIQEHVAQSEVLLAVIGKDWCDALGVDGSRRLDDPADIVRVEIQSALDQDKRVIPVLIGDIKMPVPEKLPESLRPLARRNAVQIRHERFSDDTARLTKALESVVRANNSAGRISSLLKTRLQNRAAVRFAIVSLGLAAALIAIAMHDFGPVEHNSQSSPSQPRWCLNQNLKPDELRICATKPLWTLDNQLNELFQTVLDKTVAPDRKADLVKEEDIWVMDTRGRCIQDEDCILARYRERIAYFNKLKDS